MQDITNYFQMTELVATSGQPTEQQFADIAAAGFEVVVNLAMPDNANALANEGAIVSGHGMTYVHIPVPWETPSVDHLNQYLAVMQAFKQRRVWVHCVVNARVSAFNYHYLKFGLGLSEKSCRSPLLNKWQDDMEPVWQAFMAIPREQMTALGAA